MRLLQTQNFEQYFIPTNVELKGLTRPFMDLFIIEV